MRDCFRKSVCRKSGTVFTDSFCSVLQVFIDGQTRIAQGAILRLEGSVLGGNPADFSFRWSETAYVGTPDAIDLSDARVTLGSSQRNLVIAPGLLQPRRSYVRAEVCYCPHYRQWCTAVTLCLCEALPTMRVEDWCFVRKTILRCTKTAFRVVAG